MKRVLFIYNRHAGKNKTWAGLSNIINAMTEEDCLVTAYPTQYRGDAGEAIAWIKKCVDLGAGEIVVNSIDTDGVKGGFDLEMLDAVCNAVSVPVIASGGAGKVEDFTQLFQTLPGVDAGLAASVFHFGQIAIPDLKAELRKNGILVR